MKKAALTLVLVGFVGVGAVFAYQVLQPSPETVYVVVKGDTLFEIGQAHGVSVAELKQWNNLRSDTIEIGQQLIIRTGTAPPTRHGTGRATSKRQPPPRVPTGRVRPTAKPCLAAPTGDDLGEEGFVGSNGLSEAQIREAMNAALPEVLPCIGEHSPRESLDLEITVACTGLVDRIAVASSGDWPGPVAECVVSTLRAASFPNHDLPDGETFAYPLRFSP